jgi:hypothetical protein
MAILNRKPQLDPETVKSFQAQLDDWIDAKAEEVKRENPNVPMMVCRNILMARANGCQCRGFLLISEQDQ